MRTRAQVMKVISDCLDVVVGVWIEMVARLSFVPAALDDVIQVRNNASRQEGLAMIIEVDTPRITGAVREDFEDMSRWMIAPDAGIDRHAFGIWCSRLANA